MSIRESARKQRQRLRNPKTASDASSASAQVPPEIMVPETASGADGPPPTGTLEQALKQSTKKSPPSPATIVANNRGRDRGYYNHTGMGRR